MPNAHDYRAAARRLRHLAARILHESAVVRAVADPARFVGGPARAPLGDALDDAVTSVRLAADEIERLAAVCDRRAELCAGYAADLDRHRRLATGAPAVPPAPPAWWVEP